MTAALDNLCIWLFRLGKVARGTAITIHQLPLLWQCIKAVLG